MPQIQVIDTTERSPDPTGVEKFFSKIAKSYKDDKDKSFIGDVLKEYQQNRENANAFEDAQIRLETSDLSPSRRMEVQNTLNQSRKTITERDKFLNTQAKEIIEKNQKEQDKKRSQESVYELYKPHMDEQEARRLSTIDNEATARSKVAQVERSNKPEQKSQFEKTLEAEEAKKLVKLEEDIPKARDALSNLDRIESLAENELSGIKGFGKAFFNTEAAKEMENLSFTAIEPIIKLFNPVGPIPVQKVKIIQQQFQAHPGDLATTIKGKISALRRIGQQGLARAEERAGLIRKYKGAVPPEELQNFDNSSLQLQDALVDQESFNIKMKDKKEDELVDGFYSAKDGRKLKPLPKKEAKKLYDQGLITNVPRS